jgi:hypothetical protein
MRWLGLALWWGKPEIVSCRISEMSRQRRSDVSFEARSRRPRRISGWNASGIATSEISARRQSLLNSTATSAITVSPSFSRSPAISETALWIFSTSVVMWLISEPVVLRPRNVNDCFSTCPYSALRRSVTARWPAEATNVVDR